MSTHGDKRRPCAGLWNTPMVYVNGDITTCCLDQHMGNKLGNITEQSLHQIWNSKKNHDWRLAQVADSYEASGPYCSECNWQSAGALPHDKVEAYLKTTGEEDALAAYRERWGLD